jgi:hypothetical protein
MLGIDKEQRGAAPPLSLMVIVHDPSFQLRSTKT